MGRNIQSRRGDGGAGSKQKASRDLHTPQKPIYLYWLRPRLQILKEPIAECGAASLRSRRGE